MKEVLKINANEAIIIMNTIWYTGRGRPKQYEGSKW